MAQELLYPTVLKYAGPWLIGAKDLLALDEIFDQIIGGGDASDGSRSLKIFLSKDRELKTSSFKEAMSHVGEALTVKVGPTSSTASQNIVGLIKTWVADVQPSRWKRWLLAPRSVMRIFFFLVAVFGSLILFSTTPTPSDYKETYKQQARELLKNGIDERNQAKATEVLLALQSDYIPPGAKAQHSQRSLVIFLVAVLVLAILSATPSMCLGIWRGKQRLRLWDLWFRINFYTIPTLIFSTFFWPQLLSVVGGAIRH